MVDTTPDVSHKDQINVICKYFTESGVPCKRLIDLKDVRDRAGAGQAAAITSSVNSQGLDSGQIAFQSYDFINCMSGERNGAQTIVSQLLGRDGAIYSTSKPRI